MLVTCTHYQGVCDRLVCPREELRAQINAVGQARIANMSRAVGTRSRRVFAECQARRAQLASEDETLRAQLRALEQNTNAKETT